MSGPIIRKYGFPNYDKIFGEKPLEHGADVTETTNDDPAGDSEPSQAAESPKSTKKGASSKKK
jgi:hypothetical protein